MAKLSVDLNAPPQLGGKESWDLNKEPDEAEDVHNEVSGGHHLGVNPDETPEAQVITQAENGWYPFDLNDPQQSGQQENLVTGDEQDAMDDLIHDFGVFNDVVNIVFDQEELSDSENEEEQQEDEGGAANRIVNLTNRQRQDIYEDLLRISNNGKLKKNSTTEIAAKYNVRKRTVQRVWQRAKKCWAQGIPVNVNNFRAKNCGRKKVQVDLSRVSEIPLNRRGTIRALAHALGIKKSTLHDLFKAGELRRHSNALRPYLKEENKKERLRWCLSMLDARTSENNPTFMHMENIIHTDEKWFNGTKKNKTMYLHPDEEDPHRTVQNKNAIHKVMFYSAIARPRFDAEGRCYFDGKIGTWAFVRKEPAQRRSDNRPRGTPITKTIKVDRNTMRSYMIAKLLPAIKNCWPREDAHKPILIQQDNAPSHVLANDDQFAAAVAQTGLDIRLINQPANSPDMNCLDLGFFASLQSLTDTTTSTNMDELIVNVYNEFEKYNPLLLNRVFLTLQSCMIEVMKCNGGNRYKIPHMNKERLEALGMLPRTLTCDREVVERAMQLLSN